MVVVRLWSTWKNFVSREDKTTSSYHNRCACVAITIAVTIAITIADAFGSDHNRCGPCVCRSSDHNRYDVVPAITIALTVAITIPGMPFLAPRQPHDITRSNFGAQIS